MKNYLKHSVLALLIFLAAGCGKKTAQLQSKAVPPDKTLFENATEYLEKSQFIKARLSFQTLINAYPDSEFTPKAFFEIGNTHYKEGGTEALLQAEAQFKDFQLFYPTSELAPEAQFKVAALHMRMMQEPERDSSHTKKAEEELKRFINKYPDHELAPAAKLLLKDVMENQAMSIFKIAEFYNSKKALKAAIGRYKQIMEQYPDFSRADETLLKLGQALEKINRADEAALYYARLSSEYANSEKVELARQKLQALNKPIPPVNVALAAQHQKVENDAGFFLLRPLKDFAAAMGLSGHGDPYQKAVEMVAESRQAAATAQAPEPDPTKKAETADDIVISTTLTKSANSPATATTTVQDPAKNKKKEVKKDKKDSDKEKKPKN